MANLQSVRLQAIRTPKRETDSIQPNPEHEFIFPREAFSDQVIKLLEEPRTIEDTRVPQEFLASLALKILYFNGTMKGWQVAQDMRLHFSGVVEPILQMLKRHHLLQVVGGSNLNRASYQYSITDKGSQRARELLERNRYAGPCPVSLNHYIQLIKLQQM